MGELFAYYDKDDDDLLCLDDFKCLYCEAIGGNSECPDCVEDEVLDPVAIFNENDTDYNEQICADEFGVIYDLYCDNCGYTQEDLIAHFDQNQDGCLCHLEFKEMFCYIKGVCSDEIKAKDVFDEFAGEDNTLSQSEFAVIFYLHCQECEKTIDEMFEIYDLDKNWQFTLEEFETLFCEELGICGCPVAGATCGSEA